MEPLLLLLTGLLLVLHLILHSRMGRQDADLRSLRSDQQGIRDLLEGISRSVASREERAEPTPGEPIPAETEEPETPAPEPESEPGTGESEPVPEVSPEPQEAELPPSTPPPLPARAPAPEPVLSAARTETAAPVVTPREPSKFETAARDILAKIWSWIVVGEEHRPENVTMEFAVATTWLLRLGVLILVIGIGFFLRYTATNDMFGPVPRVAVALLTGALLLGGGVKLFRGRYDLLGQGLAGAGFATFYFSFFTAHRLEVIGTPLAFGMMILVTVAAGFVAVKNNSLLIAVLGILGGYLTPFMIETDDPSVVSFLGYLLLLGLGVFFIAWKKNWRILTYLSFAATTLLVWRAIDLGFEPEKFWEFMPFLVGYFVLFSTVTFLYHLIHREKSTLLELLFLFLNAGVFLGFSIYLVENTYSREAIAFVTVGLAIFYIAHIVFFLKREIHDRGLLMSFIGLASFFVAITLPLVLSEGWITVSWAVQGFVMLWIASRMRSEFLRQLAYVLYLIVLARFAIFDLRGQFQGLPETLSTKDYFVALVERIFVFGVPIGSFLAAGRLFSKTDDGDSNWIVGEKNDIRPWFGQSQLSRICFWIVVALAFVVLNLEVVHTVGVFYDPFTRPALTLVWLLLAAVFLREMLANRETIATVAFWITISAIAIKVFFFDFFHWDPDWDLAYRQNDPLGGVGMRFVNYGAILGFFVFAWQIFRARGDRGRAASVFGYASLASLFIYLTLEVWTGLTQFEPDFRSGGISIFWAIFALSLLLVGISKSQAVLRGIGLLLFVGVIVKVFVIDLAGLDPIYRIISFILLGLVVLFGSFYYLKFRDRFLTNAPEGEADSPEGTEEENPPANPSES